MRYKKYRPSPLLRPFVVDYYLWESRHPLDRPFSITSSANGCLAMVFNYGESYCLYNILHNGTRLPTQFLSGQSTSPFTLQLRGRVGMAGIIFRGSSLCRLFSLPPLKAFQNDRANLSDLIGPEAEFVTEQLAEVFSPSEKIQILENFLLRRLKTADPEPTLAERAANVIYQNRGMIKMDELARQLYISPRQLRRRFKAEAGFNPKYVARLKRFSYVNLCLTQNPDFSWQMFLDRGLFYDQSHFIKDYQEFFGKTPTIQIRENRKVAHQLTT